MRGLRDCVNLASGRGVRPRSERSGVQSLCRIRGSSQRLTPGTGNRRARGAMGAPAEPAGRGFVARRGWFKDSRAVGSPAQDGILFSEANLASCALRDSHSSQQITEFPSEDSHSQQSPISRPLVPLSKGLLHISGVSWLEPQLRAMLDDDGAQAVSVGVSDRALGQAAGVWRRPQA